VPAAVGWWGAQYFADAVPVAAVLRSWEDRFGARLFEIGLTAIRLLVQRPPHSLSQALPVAAEQAAFASKFSVGGPEFDDIPHIAAAMIDAPVWGISWA
jgi:hypothetical protein